MVFENKTPALFFSPRLHKQDIIHKMICNESRVESYRLKKGLLRREDWPKVTNTAGKLADCPLFIDDNPQISVDYLQHQIGKLKKSASIGVVIIDGLNYINNYTDKIGHSLRLISRHFRVPIIATLSLQLSKRYDKRPILNDLDVTSDLRTESDIVLFLFKKDGNYYNKNLIEIILAKHKSSYTASDKIILLPEFCCFADYHANENSNDDAFE